MSEREERLAVLLRERFGDMSRAKQNPREEVPSFSAASLPPPGGAAAHRLRARTGRVGPR